ncbi:hypothetical protein ACXN5S_01515 [Pseudoroseicyclus sp. H15]
MAAAPPREMDAEQLARIMADYEAERRRYLTWLGALYAGAAILFAAGLLLGLAGETFWVIFFFAVAALVYAPIALNARLRDRQSRRILPVLAGAVGLTHRWGRAPVNELQAKGLVSKNAASVRDDDILSGEVAGVSFTAWDLRLRTGGENSSTVFDGLVVAFEPAGVAEVFVGDPLGRMPDNALLRKMIERMAAPPEGFEEAEQFEHEGRPLAAYARGGEALAFDAAAAFAATAAEVPEGAHLFRVYQSGGGATLSVTITGGLLDVGHLFTGPEALRQKLDRALARMSLPVRLALAWTEAQAEAQRPR